MNEPSLKIRNIAEGIRSELRRQGVDVAALDVDWDLVAYGTIFQMQVPTKAMVGYAEKIFSNYSGEPCALPMALMAVGFAARGDREAMGECAGMLDGDGDSDYEF